MSRDYRKYTKEEEDLIRNMTILGSTVDEIAKATGRSRASIVSKRKRLKVSKKDNLEFKSRTDNHGAITTKSIGSMFRDGMDPQYIKKRTGLSIRVIRETARNMGIVD